MECYGNVIGLYEVMGGVRIKRFDESWGCYERDAIEVEPKNQYFL